jgi:hypothetical protein
MRMKPPVAMFSVVVVVTALYRAPKRQWAVPDTWSVIPGKGVLKVYLAEKTFTNLLGRGGLNHNSKRSFNLSFVEACLAIK